MENIGSILSNIIRDFGIQAKLDGCKAVTIWPEVVGAQISSYTIPERFSSGKLFVRVTHDTWRTELTYHKKTLIKKLNDRLGNDTVNEIVLI